MKDVKRKWRSKRENRKYLVTEMVERKRLEMERENVAEGIAEWENSKRRK